MLSRKIKKNIIFSCFIINSCGWVSLHASLEEFDDALYQLVTPQESSFFDDVLVDTKEITFGTLKSSAQTAYRLAQNVSQGDLSDLSKAIIHLMLAKLSGRTHVDIFSDSADFTHKELAVGADRLSKDLIEKMKGKLHKVRSKSDDTHIPGDKKKTFLYAITHKIVPHTTPLRGVLLSLSGSQTVEDYVRRRMVKMALKFVEGLAQNKNLMLSATSGEVIVTPFHKTYKARSSDPLKEESASYANKFWESLKPYVLHKMRGYTQILLQKSLKACVEKMDDVLRKGAIGLGIVGGAIVGGGVMTFGAALPLIGGLFNLFGMGTTLGLLGGCTMGGLTGSSFLDAMGKNMTKRMDVFCEVLASRILTYTPQEHALYGLNPKESQLERDLFPQDYARREALRKTHVHASVEIIRALSQGNLKDIFKVLSHELGKEVRSIVKSLWKMFRKTQKIPTSTVIEQFGLDQDSQLHPHVETRAKAYRRFIALSQENPELLKAVRQYPGYEMKMTKLRFFNYTPDERGQDLFAKTRQDTQYLQKISQHLMGDFEDENLSSKVFNVLLDLSIVDQDRLMNMGHLEEGSDPYGELREKISQGCDHSFSHQKALATIQEYLLRQTPSVLKLKAPRFENRFVEVPRDTLQVMGMYYQEIMADNARTTGENYQGQEQLLQNTTSEASSSKDREKGVYLMRNDTNAVGLKRFSDFLDSTGVKQEMLPSLDLTALTQILMMQKQKALINGEDQVFFDQNKEEIYDFISASESPVKGRLWYSLEEVIEGLRLKKEANQSQIIASVQ